MRFIHFLPSDRYGLDPLRGFTPHLSVTAAECRRPGRILAGIINGRDGLFHRNSRIMALVALLSGFMEPLRQKPVSSDLESVCVWIRQHAGEAITACDAAGQYPHSRSKFFADFTRAYGVAPGEYIMRERIRFAAALMRAAPDAPIKEIAWRGGWKNPYHFSRCFRSVAGEPPGRYRSAIQTF